MTKIYLHDKGKVNDKTIYSGTLIIILQLRKHKDYI